MNFTDPIREIKKISQIKNLLRAEKDFRNLSLFHLAISSALRISDLLSLRVGDLFNGDDLSVKDFFDIREEKTGKSNRITITPKVKITLAEYAEFFPLIVRNPENFVFFRKKTYPLGSKPIGRKMSWLFMSKICEDVGLKGNFGNHSTRKTWGYQARMAGVPIEIIQHKLNHFSIACTMKYLGITADEIEEVCNRLNL